MASNDSGEQPSSEQSEPSTSPDSGNDQPQTPAPEEAELAIDSNMVDNVQRDNQQPIRDRENGGSNLTDDANAQMMPQQAAQFNLEDLRPGVALAQRLQETMAVQDPELLERVLERMLEESRRRLQALAWARADRRRHVSEETEEQQALQVKLWDDFWKALGLGDAE